jgi:glycosyltransferase involved in cell wall biosynthesis
VALVDGMLVGRTLVGSEARPDVAEALGSPRLADSGWTIRADLSGLTDQGPAELVVVVWADPGRPPVALDPVPLVVDDAAPTQRADGAGGRSLEFSAFLDLPAPDQLVGPDAFRVAGWAMHHSSPISRIDVLVNGRLAGPARLGCPRPDVAATSDRPDAAISGFDYVVNLSARDDPTSHVKLQLVARAGGRPAQVILERTAAVGASQLTEARSGRDAQLQERRLRLLSYLDQPRSDGLNLVVFTHDLGYGGAQLWLDELLNRAGAGTKFPCTVISRHDGPLRDSLERRGIPVHVTQSAPVDDIEAYEGRVIELTALVAAGGHTAALVNTFTSLIGADIATRLGLPTVWAIHESHTPEEFWAMGFSPGPAHPDVRAAGRRALAASDALVFEAEATRQLYASSTKGDRTIVVPYGIDTQAVLAYCERVSRAQARADTGISPDTKVLLVMGTIEPRKAQTQIATAFGLIKDDHPDWTLVFVGDNESPYAETLKEYLRASGLENRTMVVPVVEDTYRWYRAADVLLSASDRESLPRSALETMCFGVPVLATAVFGLPELLEDATTGFLFAPNDLDAATAALRRVLGLDPTRLAAVGAAGRDLVLEHYDSAGYAADVVTLLEGLGRGRDLTPAELLARPGRPTRRVEPDRTGP